MHILEPCRKYILCDATIKWVCPLFLGRKIFFHQRLNCRVVSYLPLWTQNFFGMCLMCAKRLYFGGCFIGKYILLSTIHWHMLKCDPPPISSSDGSWGKFMWIEQKRYFTFHHLHVTWNQWMTVITIFHDFE